MRSWDVTLVHFPTAISGVPCLTLIWRSSRKVRTNLPLRRISAREDYHTFKAVLRKGTSIVIGWPILFETRMVLTAKRFSNPGDIVTRFFNAPNITGVAFDTKHY